MTRGAEIPLLAGEWSEILITAVIVTTLDSCHSQGVVTTSPHQTHLDGMDVIVCLKSAFTT